MGAAPDRPADGHDEPRGSGSRWTGWLPIAAVVLVAVIVVATARVRQDTGDIEGQQVPPYPVGPSGPPAAAPLPDGLDLLGVDPSPAVDPLIAAAGDEAGVVELEITADQAILQVVDPAVRGGVLTYVWWRGAQSGPERQVPWPPVEPRRDAFGIDTSLWDELPGLFASARRELGGADRVLDRAVVRRNHETGLTELVVEAGAETVVLSTDGRVLSR